MSVGAARRLRHGGWTITELRRPIAWDGPWTDGRLWFSLRSGWCEPMTRMVWRSSTGRKLTSYGNQNQDWPTVTAGTHTFWL